MIRHHITKYRCDGKRFVESWLQVSIFGKAFCFSVKRLEI